jgi:hypothetical protein
MSRNLAVCIGKTSRSCLLERISASVTPLFSSVADGQSTKQQPSIPAESPHPHGELRTTDPVSGKPVEIRIEVRLLHNDTLRKPLVSRKFSG